MKIKSKLCNSEYLLISKLFSSATFNYLATQEEDKIEAIYRTFKSFCDESMDFTLEKAYSEFYKLLSKKYRNEYVFKNIIFRDIILKKHNLKNCVTIPEFIVGKSKADLAVFNGASTVYEIKSEIDTTERLASQLLDYSSYFEFINVVISERHLKKIRHIAGENIGILVLDETNKINIFKESVSNLQNISHKSLFYSLRKNEYLDIIAEVYGCIPIMPNTMIFEYCFDLFKQIELEKAQSLALAALKKRILKQDHINLIKRLPVSLKSITIQQTYNKNKCNNILNNIQKVFI
ncbi:sce7726 family protein [Epilithonimonas zeae]|uniref:Sce7726 family protein n=1 Tax=Epilithonimonas zeae TaxID=1416779 RepID=A0A1N6FW79_9FLAO|nr:sce7726 family protein [Epilithonimonas zeae]SIN99503.1 hypothetical protein SAMN05444409_1513 [Epilithonimonas zeae]